MFAAIKNFPTPFRANLDGIVRQKVASGLPTIRELSGHPLQSIELLGPVTKADMLI
jgi:hypothetical protein